MTFSIESSANSVLGNSAGRTSVSRRVGTWVWLQYDVRRTLPLSWIRSIAGAIGGDSHEMDSPIVDGWNTRLCNWSLRTALVSNCRCKSQSSTGMVDARFLGLDHISSDRLDAGSFLRSEKRRALSRAVCRNDDEQFRWLVVDLA